MSDLHLQAFFEDLLLNRDEDRAREFLKQQPQFLDGHVTLEGSMIQYLINLNKIVAVETLLRLGCQVDILTDGRKATPLHLAAAYGYPAIIKLLLRFGATIDATDLYGLTPLHLAVYRGQISTVKLLLRMGSKAINSPSNTGFIPMFMPATSFMGWDPEIVSMLRACGSNIDPPPELIERIPVSLIHFLNQPMNPEDATEIRHRIYFKHSLIKRTLNSLLE